MNTPTDCLPYVYFIDNVRTATDRRQISLATVVISWVILGLLLAMLVFAYPSMRNRFHDYFEWTHRFLGWTAVALIWALLILFINDGREPEQNLGQACTHNAAFWLQCIITLSIIIPWLRLRKIDVRAVTLSKHATRLYLNYSVYLSFYQPSGEFETVSRFDSPIRHRHDHPTHSLAPQGMARVCRHPRARVREGRVLGRRFTRWRLDLQNHR